MSLKPPKKGDIKKKWLTKRIDREIRIQPKYHLIVTEGTATEPQYFKSMKDIINKKYRERIKLDIFGEGYNTLSLMEKALKRVVNSPNVYKHVWIVYDTDEFPPDHINRTAETCSNKTTEETQYHAVWSNQCIELWYLLHFSYMHSDIHRNEYWPKLTNCLQSIGKGEYLKGRDDMFDILRPYMDQAIRYARKLDENNCGKTPSDSAPGTKVYELIEKLRPYL